VSYALEEAIENMNQARAIVRNQWISSTAICYMSVSSVYCIVVYCIVFLLLPFLLEHRASVKHFFVSLQFLNLGQSVGLLG
jgi:hypothetical protein